MQASADHAMPAGDLATTDGFGRPPRDRLRRLVTDILATRSIAKPFSDGDTLAEVGLTSVDMVTLMLAVENEFTLEIPQGDITAEVFRSVATLENLILRLQPPPGIAR